MVHAIEAYTSAHLKNPVSDMLAIKALELLSRHILTACRDGGNKEARSAMLLGHVRRPGFANSPVAAVHALAYPIGGIFHVPHGLSNALVLAPVLKFNAPAASGACRNRRGGGSGRDGQRRGQDGCLGRLF